MKLKQQEKMEWIAAVAMIGIGLFCILFPYRVADGLMITLAVLCTLSAGILLIQAWKRKNMMEALKGVAAGVIACFLWGYRAEGALFISTLFGWYMIGTGLILCVEGLMDLKEKSRTGWSFLLLGLAAFIMGIVLNVAAKDDPRLIQIVIGLYLIYQGLQLLIELYAFARHSGSRSWSFRYWSSLPVYIVAAGPSLLLRLAEKKKMDISSFPFDQHKNDEPVNLRVFVHTGLSGDHQFGHMTFSYQGIMYSYGNYDTAEEKLFRTFGPGILFTVPCEIYVNNSCVYEDSTLFEFGIHLDRKQEDQLRQILKHISNETYRWYAPISRLPLSETSFQAQEKDYASRLYWRTGSKYYKFRRGIWKTYWVFGSNCSLFASRILHELDRNYVLPRGINTPGEYFEFFSEAFQDPASNVVYRSWHTAQIPETLYPSAL